MFKFLRTMFPNGAPDMQLSLGAMCVLVRSKSAHQVFIVVHAIGICAVAVQALSAAASTWRKAHMGLQCVKLNVFGMRFA